MATDRDGPEGWDAHSFVAETIPGRQPHCDRLLASASEPGGEWVLDRAGHAPQADPLDAATGAAEVTPRRIQRKRRDPRCTCDIVRRAIVPEEHNESCPVLSARTTEWRDIKTAPRDGTVIILRVGRLKFRASWREGLYNSQGCPCGGWHVYGDDACPSSWSDGVSWARNADGLPSKLPTHWMPLPEPPK